MHLVLLDNSDTVANDLQRINGLLEVVLVQVATFRVLLYFGDHATESTAANILCVLERNLLIVFIGKLINVAAVLVAFSICLFLIERSFL